MSVVQHDVPDAGFRQGPHQVRPPDAFGQPRALRAHSKMLLKIIAEPRELRGFVGIGNGGKDGFEKSSAHQLHLTARRQLFDLLEKLGMALFNPLQQAAGKMQPHADARMAKERPDKRAVSLLVSFFENVIEVADGLMRVDHQRQGDLVQQATSFRFERRSPAATFAQTDTARIK